MVILNQNLIDKKLINIKVGLLYSENYTFIPLLYDKKDIIFQTPKLYTQYGINDKYDKNFIDLSFRNNINDDTINTFHKNMDIIYSKVNSKYKKFNTINYLKKNENDKDIYMRLKIQDNILIFDQNKNKLNHIIPNIYGNFIIHLQGVWIIDNDIYFQWYLLQAKIDMPLYLDKYSFVDNTAQSLAPRPPPPPPLPPHNFKLKIASTNNNNNIDNKMNNKKKKIIIKKDINVPSLNDIKNALNNLKSINN